MNDSAPKFVFEGFGPPRYTNVPDEVFDVIAPELKEGELRVLLYIIRRTFGFKKDADNIALSQMVNGIVTSDGKVLDRGTGMKKAAVLRSLQGLEGKGIIVRQRNRSTVQGNEATTYALRFKGDPWYPKGTKGGILKRPSLAPQRDPQDTVVQETVSQQPDLRPGDTSYPYVLRVMIQDVGRELNDTDRRGSVGTIVNIWKAAGRMPAEQFITYMQEAREITKRSVGNSQVRSGKPGRREGMGYFFAVLRERLGLPLDR